MNPRYILHEKSETVVERQERSFPSVSVMNEKQILIVAGEASGEMYGAALVKHIQSQAREPLVFFGCAGKAMREAGVEAIVAVEEISVHGMIEVLAHLDVVFDGFGRLIAEADKRRPELVILIDFPDFNIRLASRLKHLGARIVYFISPQLWAWRRGRAKVLREIISEMICILPFEESFYREAGIPAEYVGHPLVEMLEVDLDAGEFFSQNQLEGNRARVALLPGSRKNEIRHNLPELLQTVAGIQSLRSDIQFLLAVSATVGTDFVKHEIERWRRAMSLDVNLRIIANQTRSVLKYSDVAVVSSGTATLESALLGTPLVCVYKVSPLSWWIGQTLIDVDYYCLVNLILNRPVVSELYQSDFSSEKLSAEIFKLLDEPMARERMVNDFAGLKDLLAKSPSPLQRSAQIVLSHLETQTLKSESNEAVVKPSQGGSGTSS